MQLDSSNYKLIMRQYDELQSKNRLAFERKLDEIYTKIPEIRILNEHLASESVRLAKLSILNPSDPIPNIKEIANEVACKKRALLVSHGFSPDYLEPEYTCPDCQDTGFTLNGEKCHCFKQRLIKLLYSNSNLQNTLERENFSKFSYAYYSDQDIDPVTNKSSLDNIKRVVCELWDFINHFNKPHDKRSLLIYGTTGVGKTFLLNCVAKELIEKMYSCIYLSSISLFELLGRYKFSDDKYLFYKEYDNLLECDLLIIDDLGTEITNAFTSSQLYMCINERHIRGKSTIISTNLSLEDILNSYGERVFSRIVADYSIQKIYGKDIRTN